jgi:hypothetical protein
MSRMHEVEKWECDTPPPPHSNGAVFYTFVSFRADAKMQRLIAIDSAATITKL